MKQKITGFINLHKPLGLSSAQAVGKVKWLLKPEKIGHAGTLDPLATGILPLALGEGTKCVNLLMDASKIYEFSVTFGERRATDDAEGEVVATSDVMPTEEAIRAALFQFIGEIEQTPPAYSAIKVDGERAYNLARAGEEVELKSRRVRIDAFELLGTEVKFCSSPLEGEPNPSLDLVGGKTVPYMDISMPGKAMPPTKSANADLAPPQGGSWKIVAHFRARVGKGTYIRSLGRDLARVLGSEGYISRLHRAAVGPFTEENAISLDFLENLAHNAAPAEIISSAVLPLETVLDGIPALALSAQEHRRLVHGQSVMLAKPIAPNPQIAVTVAEKLVALARCEDGRTLITQRILNV